MTTDHIKLPKTSLIKSFARGRFYLATIAGILTAITVTGARRVLALMPIITLSTPLTGATLLATAKDDETIVITPAATIAALTVTLPSAEDSQLGQIKRIHSSQIVTALTVDVAGSGSVTGTALTAMAADTPYAYQCVSVSGAGTWLRIQ